MFGPCRGGVVRLAEPGAVLMVGEGIEKKKDDFAAEVMAQVGQAKQKT